MCTSGNAFILPIRLFFLFAPLVGEAAELVFNPIAWAFWAHKHLSGWQKHGVEICAGGTCRTNLGAAEAGGRVFATVASRDGDVWGVLTNEGDAAVPVTLAFSGLDGMPTMTVMSLSAATAAGVTVPTEPGADGVTYRPTSAALSGLDELIERTEVVGQQGRYRVTIDAQSLVVFSL